MGVQYLWVLKFVALGNCGESKCVGFQIVWLFKIISTKIMPTQNVLVPKICGYFLLLIYWYSKFVGSKFVKTKNLHVLNICGN